MGQIGPCPVHFLTNVSTNSVPVSPFETYTPFLAQNTEFVFFNVKYESIPLSVPKKHWQLYAKS
jgi:hypothetical protein